MRAPGRPPASGTTGFLDNPTLKLAALPVLVMTGGLGAWLLLIAGSMPDPVASHWDLAGTADGFSSFPASAWSAVLTMLWTGLFCSFCSSVNRLPVGARRLSVLLSVVLTGFLALMFIAGIAPQHGMASADGSTMNWAVVPWGIGVPVLAGWALSRRVPSRRVPGATGAAVGGGNA